MPVTKHLAKFTVEGTFNAKEAVEYVASVLVGRTYVYDQDEARVFNGTISIEVDERLPEQDQELVAHPMRVRELSPEGNEPSLLSGES